MLPDPIELGLAQERQEATARRIAEARRLAPRPPTRPSTAARIATVRRGLGQALMSLGARIAAEPGRGSIPSR